MSLGYQNNAFCRTPPPPSRSPFSVGLRPEGGASASGCGASGPQQGLLAEADWSQKQEKFQIQAVTLTPQV